MIQHFRGEGLIENQTRPSWAGDFLLPSLGQLPQALLCVDTDERITWLSDIACDLLGFLNEELYGKSVSILDASLESALDSSSYAGLESHKQAATSTRSTSKVGYDSDLYSEWQASSLMHKNGSILCCNVKRFPLKDAEGQLVGFGILLEIDANSKNSMNPASSESHYHSLVERSLAGILETSSEGELLSANPAMVRILGYDSFANAKANIGNVRNVYVKDTDRDRLICLLKEKGSIEGLEVEWKRRDQSSLWVLLNAHISESLSDGSFKIMFSVIDFTERMYAQQKMKEQTAILESTPTGIVVLDMEHNILYWNQGQEKIFKISREDIVGQNARERLPSAGREEYDNRFEILLKDGEWSGEATYELKDGTTIVVEGRWTLIRDENDRPKSIVLVNQDITSRKRLEAQFARVQRLKSVGTLASGIAHDFNNILGIILAYTTLLRQSLVDPQLKAHLNLVTEAIHRGAQLVKQILTFARQTEVSKEPTNVNKVIQEVHRMIEETFPRLIELKINLDTQMPTTLIDSNQFHEALLNLCVNARDAIMERRGIHSVIPSPDTPPLIEICSQVIPKQEVERQFPKGESDFYVVVSVKDNGKGMDEETKQRIFEPFFSTKKGAGSGLGMSVVFGIVQSHGGYVDVESEPGKGTTVVMYFPLEDTKLEVETKVEIMETNLTGKETILFVDDEVSLRMTMKIFLESKGYSVILASSGQEAVEVFKENAGHIDLVLSDNGLPRMSGVEAFKHIREISSSVPFILASGYIDNSEKSEILALGVQDFIQKPYEMAEITRRMRLLLDKKTD